MLPLSSFVPERSAAEDVAPVAAVILSFNSESTLAVVLDRVAAQTVRPARTIVVDNGSVDGTQQLLSGCRRCRNAPARHELWCRSWAQRRLARRDDSIRVGFVWALEHDTFPAPDCLERLLTSFDEADSTVPMGAAIPAQQTVEGTRAGRPTEPIPTRMLHFNGALLRVPAAGCGRPVLGGVLLRARGPRARATNEAWRLAHALGAPCPCRTRQLPERPRQPQYRLPALLRVAQRSLAADQRTQGTRARSVPSPRPGSS